MIRLRFILCDARSRDGLKSIKFYTVATLSILLVIVTASYNTLRCCTVKERWKIVDTIIPTCIFCELMLPGCLVPDTSVCGG